MTSDISQADIELACGGPLDWPADPLERMLYYCWVCNQLRESIGSEQTSLADFLGSFGTRETDTLMHEASLRVGRMNSLHTWQVDWEGGAAGIAKLLKTPHEDWPYPPERYRL